MLAESIFYLSGCPHVYHYSIHLSPQVIKSTQIFFMDVSVHTYTYTIILNAPTPGVMRWRTSLLQGHCGYFFSDIQRGNGHYLTHRNNQC